MAENPIMAIERLEFGSGRKSDSLTSESIGESNTKNIKHFTKKNKWTDEEDKILVESVKRHGNYNWPLIASALPGRTGKQCRERWLNQLNPDVLKSEWTCQEDAILVQQQKNFGNCWAKISKALPGRGSSAVKNRWNWLNRHKNRIVRQSAILNANLLVSNKPTVPNENRVPVSFPPELAVKRSANTFHFDSISNFNVETKQHAADTILEASLHFDLDPFTTILAGSQLEEKDEEIFWFNL